MTDAFVWVTRACCTPYEAVRRARALLDGSGALVLGVALKQEVGYGYGYSCPYGYGGGDAESGGAEESTGESDHRRRT